MFALHDHIGCAPDRYRLFGKRIPRYRWMWTADLWFPFRKGNKEVRTPAGLIVLEPNYEMVRQYDEDAYCIAKWEAPPPPSQWIAQYGRDLGYMGDGMYLVTNIVLPQGVEPTEALTQEAIEMIVSQQTRSYRELLEESERRNQAHIEEGNKRMRDAVMDSLTVGDTVPGKRGYSTSFGGFEPPPQSAA